jgi:hypothetical protein
MPWTVQLFFIVIAILAYLVAPISLLWGWIRWVSGPKSRTVTSVLSLIGFLFATASALLAIASIVYAHVIGGFPFYDRRLMRIYAWGLLIALCGLLFGIGGLVRSNRLRWHAPLSAIAMLAFWIGVAEAE